MLGSAEERYVLAEEAREVEAWDILEAQYEWIVRVSEPLDVYWSNASQLLARSEKVDAERAMRMMRAFTVVHIGSSAIFISEVPDIEVNFAWQQHVLAAKAAAGRKDWAGVMAEVEAEVLLYPEDPDGVLAIVPVLDAAGRKEDADRLVGMMEKYFEDLLAKYPRAASKHNGLAWLCGKTGRDLDEALEHAQKAVEFMPKSPGYLDTLAEVHFARGEVEEAVATEKRAVALEPGWGQLREQLARFERAVKDKGE